MIQDYRLLGYNLPHNLEETVQNYIKQGYQPYGSPFVDGDHYYQAVVKQVDPHDFSDVMNIRHELRELPHA